MSGQPEGGARRPIRPRTIVIAVVLALVAALCVAAEVAPGSSSGFSSAVTNSTDTAGTAGGASFSPNGGVFPYNDSFNTSTASSDLDGSLGWTNYGGTWTNVNDDIYSETAGGNSGNKSLTGQTTWTDYTVQADVRLDTAGEAGLVFRATNPSVGADAFNGYYVGIYSSSGALTMGRENGSYTRVGGTTGNTYTVGTWYHVSVQAVGCAFVVSAGPLTATAPSTSFTYTDPAATCFTAGKIGLRDMTGATASFRNVTATASGTTAVTPATFNAGFGTTTPTGWTSRVGTWAGTATTQAANAASVNTYSTSSTSATTSSSFATAVTPSYVNSTMTAEVQLTGSVATTASAGFLVRSTSSTTPATGYYVALSSSGLSINRTSSATSTVLGTPTTFSPTVALNTWYHLAVETVGCVVTATAQIKTGGPLIVATYNDSSCTATTAYTAVGLRAVATTAAFRGVAVTPRA